MGIEQPQDEQEPGLTGAAGADPSGGEEASSTRTRRPSLEIVLDAIPGRPSQSVPPELPTLREFGRYELLGRLAIGGMAEIFLARERSEVGGSRHLVVKVIRPEFANDPEFSELFLNEGKLALGLRHPNICHVYEFGIHNDHPFIAMEVVVGISLFDLLRRSARASRRIPLPVSVKVIAEVAEALHSAHGAKDPRGRSLGLVHQDVSPHNIMLGYDGVVKLLDFGVARSSLDEPESPADEEPSQPSGTIRGKFAYLAPEQCEGGTVDARSDVFALGICLYEALVGRRLFKRRTDYETLTAVLSDPLPDRETLQIDVADALWAIVEKALQKDPADRFQNAAEMQQALEVFLAQHRLVVTSGRIADFLVGVYGEAVGSGPPVECDPKVVAWLNPDPAPAAPARRQLLPWILGGGLAAAFGLGALLFGSWGAEPVPEPAGAISSAPEASPLAPALHPSGEPLAAASADASIPEAGATTEAPAPSAEEAAPLEEAEDEEARRERRRERRRRARTMGGFVGDPGF